MAKLRRAERLEKFKEALQENPFLTDDQLAQLFQVSIQTIRLDRNILNIPQLRERTKEVAEKSFNGEIKSLESEEVIGQLLDVETGASGISLFLIEPEHVFKRNYIARGHYLFAQANSLAIAIVDDVLALTTAANVFFDKQVKLGDNVIAKAKVTNTTDKYIQVSVESFVNNELVFHATFEIYHRTDKK